jgi:cytochrome c551/c552
MKRVAVFTIPGLVAFFVSHSGFAHQGHHHPGPEAKGAMTRNENIVGVRQIERDYSQKIAPIFKKSCMDCHSAQTRYPWYHKIPGIKQLLDSDISEARHHLDFTDGYPFKSHATPIEDLDAIAESVQKQSMPPWSYRLMHSGSAMTDAENKVVLDWVENSKALLKP